MTLTAERPKFRIAALAARINPYFHILLPATLTLVAGSVLVMIAAAQLRVSEMKLTLQNTDQQARTDQMLSLVARFRLNYEKIKTETNSSAYYLEEQKMLAAQAHHPEIEQVFGERPGVLSYLGAKLVILVNYLTGTVPADITGRDASDKLTELAYFYERRRAYHVAAQIYQWILQETSFRDRQYPNILLHTGFCQGLMGDFAMAIETLKSVEKMRHAGETTVKTAAQLRAYLEEVRSKRISGMKDGRSTFTSALQMYQNMQYFEALEAFNTLLLNESSQEYFFYRGRTFEEIGQADKAVADYRQAIYKFPVSQFTKFANRRLFMLGGFYENNPLLREESVKRAKLLGDDDFIRKSELYEKALSTDKFISDADFRQFRNVLNMVEKNSRISLKPGKLMQDMADWNTHHQRLGDKILQDLDPDLKSGGKLLPDAAPVDRRPVKILTADGNSFNGIVLQESESHLLLRTDIGEIKLAKKSIVLRQVIK